MTSTRAGRWILGHGVGRVARSLGVSRTAVQGWLRGRSEPRLTHVRAIVRVSGNRLTVRQVVESFESKK